MRVENLFYLAPLIECGLSDYILTFLTEINLCVIWATNLTKVGEVDVDNEVRRNYFAFILSNIFRTQLHLSRFYVVTSLDESSIEHHSEHDFVREASMHKHDLDITLEEHAFLLLLRQQKNDAILTRTVLPMHWEGKELSNIEATAAEDFEKRSTTITRHVGHFDELDAAQAFCCG